MLIILQEPSLIFMMITEGRPGETYLTDRETEDQRD